MTVDRGTLPGMSDLKRPEGTFTAGDQSTPAARTAAATAGRMRASEKRLAAKLDARGWVCFPPDYPLVGEARKLRDAVNEALAAQQTK